jgi:hypothetical protein
LLPDRRCRLDARNLQSVGYATAVGGAISARNNRAFVIEGAWDTASLSWSNLASLRPFVPDGLRLTRLSSILDPAGITGDVAFDVEFSGATPNQRVVESQVPSGRSRFAGTGFGLIALALVFVRPRPRAKGATERY